MSKEKVPYETVKVDVLISQNEMRQLRTASGLGIDEFEGVCRRICSEKQDMVLQNFIERLKEIFKDS